MKPIMRRHGNQAKVLLVAGLGIAGLVGCDSRAQRGRSAEPPGDLVPVARALVPEALALLDTAVELKASGSWSGLPSNWSDLPSVDTNYRLHRTPRGFEGEVTVIFARLRWTTSRGLDVSNFCKKISGLLVPDEAAVAFLRQLARIPLQNGPYVTRNENRDLYPFVNLEVTLPSGEYVNYYSRSQGTGHAPWAVVVRGAQYVIPSDAPAKAFEGIRRFLKQQEIREAEENLAKPGAPACKPSPPPLVEAKAIRSRLGCYELEILPWRPAPELGPEFPLPSTVELTNEAAMEDGWFKVRPGPDIKQRFSGSESWRVSDRGVELHLSGDFSLSLVLKDRSGSLVGVASTYWTEPPGPRHQADVRLKRIQCAKSDSRR